MTSVPCLVPPLRQGCCWLLSSPAQPPRVRMARWALLLPAPPAGPGTRPPVPSQVGHQQVPPQAAPQLPLSPLGQCRAVGGGEETG